MAVQRKVFRIEQMNPVATPETLLAAAIASPLPHEEILTELSALRDLIERRNGGANVTSAQAEACELRELMAETDSIQRAISRTKHELATLHVGAFDDGMSHVTRELDAVAEGAERATQRILDAVEDIEDAANTLNACLKRDQERALAQDIQDHVVRVFEACNFQDLSGQRITKVIATLKFIEERIARMMQIWGGKEALSHYTVAALGERNTTVTLRGPKLDDEPGHATQDDIDAIFAAD
jgi:chemotaxis protein CheZ